MTLSEQLEKDTTDTKAAPPTKVIAAGRKPRDKGHTCYRLVDAETGGRIVSLFMEESANPTTRDGFTDTELLRIVAYRLRCLQACRKADTKYKRAIGAIEWALTHLES